MTVGSPSSTALDASTAYGAAMAKKSNDIAKVQGQAAVDLIQSASGGGGPQAAPTPGSGVGELVNDVA
jgi:hypothetical protein